MIEDLLHIAVGWFFGVVVSLHFVTPYLNF